MGTLTLKPGPRLFYREEIPEHVLAHLNRVGELPEGWRELPQEEFVTRQAHEYLFETIRGLDLDLSLGDIVLIADGNPYLLGVYARYHAVHLVTETIRLRAETEAPKGTAQYI